MNRRLAILLLTIAALGLSAPPAEAIPPYMWPVWRSNNYSWNRNYAHTAYGQPVALVVPPTANLQTNYSWGVAGSRMSRIDHQFYRNYPGPGLAGGPFRTTPIWPSDTTQFGVYYIRGPW